MPRARTVLVVVEGVDERARVTAGLSEASYRVVAVPDVAGGLRLTASELPDLVVLDLDLGGGGWSLLDALKADARTADVPVVALSADGRTETVCESLERGAQDHLRKPYDLEELVTRVGAALRTKRATDRVVACLDQMADGLAILSPIRNHVGTVVDFMISYINPAAARIRPDITPGETYLTQNDGDDLIDAYAAVVDEDRPLHIRGTQVVDGQARTLEVSATKLGDGLVLILRDITDRAAREAEMAWAATHDPLTGLANRPLLVDRLTQALTRRPTEPPGEMAVLFVDLDGFKAVNDAHGHHVGDRTLVQVARALEAAVRPSDTVARFGGDEFVVLVEELGSPDEAKVIAGRLADAVNAVRVGERRLQASIGVALARPGDSPDSVLRLADLVMYDEKRRHTAV